MTKYIFKDVYMEGKHFPAIRTQAQNEQQALDKLVNFLLKRFQKPQSQFAKVKSFQQQNIIKGETVIEKELVQGQFTFEQFLR